MQFMRMEIAEPPATLADVARRAGVSTATVSRCLNKSGAVREETRERVEEAIRALGYTPHFGGRALASNRTDTVGVVIPTMENAIFARGLQAMEEALSASNVTLFVATSGYCAQREEEKIRALIGRGVDALALIGLERPESCWQLIRSRQLPCAVLWNVSEHSPVPCIGFDNRAAAAEMAERVLAFGHRRIAMIAGRTFGNDRALARVAGVRDALVRAGLTLTSASVVEAPYTLAAGADAAARLLGKPEPERPTAILCGNDVLAAGALNCARDLGMSVPGDLSVAGFDDIDLARAVQPALTTVHAPHREMGETAARMLLAMARDGAVGESRCLATRIVERESLGPVSAR